MEKRAHWQDQPWYRWYALALLTLVYICHFVDRTVVQAILEPLKHEFHLTDTQLGFYSGLAHSLTYAVAGIPMGMLVDRVHRRNLLSALVVFWSGLTAVSGMAQSYLFLVLARLGVGAAEAGGTPAAMSILSDLFPVRQRSTAMGIYLLGVPLGIVTGYLMGGYVAAHFGWRTVFFVAGVPGVILGLLMFFTIREPLREGSGAPSSKPSNGSPSLLATLRVMGRRPALLLVTAGMVSLNFASGTVLAWMAPFLMRLHGFSLAEAGLAIALGYGAAGAAGTVFGGVLADRLGARDVRWIPGLNAIMALLILASSVALLLAQENLWVLVFLAIFGITVSMAYGPGYGLFQSLVGAEMRGTATAILFILIAVISAGLGPQFTGFFSDLWSQEAGQESLRYAMLAGSTVSLLTAVLFLAAMRHVRAGIVEEPRAET